MLFLFYSNRKKCLLLLFRKTLQTKSEMESTFLEGIPCSKLSTISCDGVSPSPPNRSMRKSMGKNSSALASTSGERIRRRGSVSLRWKRLIRRRKVSLESTVSLDVEFVCPAEIFFIQSKKTRDHRRAHVQNSKRNHRHS